MLIIGGSEMDAVGGGVGRQVARPVVKKEGGFHQGGTCLLSGGPDLLVEPDHIGVVVYAVLLGLLTGNRENRLHKDLRLGLQRLDILNQFHICLAKQIRGYPAQLIDAKHHIDAAIGLPGEGLQRGDLTSVRLRHNFLGIHLIHHQANAGKKIGGIEAGVQH